jgi:aryl-alcohol dehydrogenase-like predicted oxidoreductase
MGVTSAQIALAWVLAQGDEVVPIQGTTRPSHPEVNIAALDIKLTQEQLDRIDEAMPPGAASGLRYPGSAMKAVNR